MSNSGDRRTGISYEIVKRINYDVFPYLRKKSITVFLIGAGRTDPSSIRDAVRKELINKKYLNWFDVYYPEELFEELLRSEAKYDLLSLENLLAKSVHAVVIVLESPGAIAELGAFSNHRILRDRLVVIVDRKYQKTSSFIMLGPVRFLRKNTKSIVLFHDLKKPKIKEICSHLKASVREISERAEVDYSVKNPIYAQYFLVSAIYLLEPVQRRTLNSLISMMGVASPKQAETILSCSLNILRRQKEAIIKDGKWRLSREGLERMRRSIRFGREGKRVEKTLDELRIEILNKTLRR